MNKNDEKKTRNSTHSHNFSVGRKYYVASVYNSAYYLLKTVEMLTVNRIAANDDFISHSTSLWLNDCLRDRKCEQQKKIQ